MQSLPKNDIICLSLSRWDSAISSPALSLAKEFAKNNRVFYIDHPFSWKDYFSTANKAQIEDRKPALLQGKAIYLNPATLPENLTVVTPRLTLPVNFLPKGFLYTTLSRYNNRIIADTIRKIIKDYSVKEYVYINFFDPYFLQQLPADIKPWRNVYQSMDDISQVAYSNRHGTRLEEEAVKHADYTLCTSKELTRLKSAFSPNVYFHPNAAETGIFKRAVTEDLPVPEELRDIKTPVIGFTGSVEYRSDFELLKKVAEYHSDKTLVFVGPVQTEEHIQVGLDRLPNVRFVGPRHITELAAYLRLFSCVLIPYRKNTLTKSIYPLKINEYLAAGKPVIATHFSEDIYSFRDVAYIVDSHEEFLQAIDQAIAENDLNRMNARIAVAEQNTWTARVEQFWKIIGPEPRRI